MKINLKPFEGNNNSSSSLLNEATIPRDINIVGILKNEEHYVEKLVDPIKKIGRFRHELIYIFPCIVTDSIGGSKEEDILRRFFVAQYLKELSIQDMVDEVNTIVNSDKDSIESISDIRNFDIPLNQSISARYASDILLNTQATRQKQIAALVKSITKIVKSDPYYQRYKAVVGLTVINNYVLPLIAGTKSFQAPDLAIAVIILTSIIFNLPLNSYRNVMYVRRILESNFVRRILDLLSSGRYINPEELERIRREVIGSNSRLRGRNRSLIGVFTSALFNFIQRIFNIGNNNNNPLNNIPSKTKGIIRERLVLTNKAIDQALRAFELSTNFSYYTSQFNPRMRDYILRLYRDSIQRDFYNCMSGVINNGVNLFLSRFIKGANINLESALSEVVNNIVDINFLNNFVIDNSDILRLIQDAQDEINNHNLFSNQEEIFNVFANINNVYQNISDDIIAFRDAVRRAVSVSKRDRRAARNASNEEVEVEVRDLLNMFINTLEKIDVDTEIANPERSNISKIFEEAGKICNRVLDNNISTVDRLDTAIRYIYDNYFRNFRLFLDLVAEETRFNIDRFFTSVRRAFTNVFGNLISTLFNSIYQNLITEIRDTRDSLCNTEPEYESEIIRVFNKYEERIDEYLRNEFLCRVRVSLLFVFIYCLNRALIKNLDVDEIKINGKKLLDVFPNYLLIIPEEMINYLVSAISVLRMDEIYKAYHLELPPERFPNPFAGNVKYKAEYIKTRAGIPNLISINMKSKSVIYHFMFMRHAEKTNINNINEFMKNYFVILKDF